MGLLRYFIVVVVMITAHLAPYSLAYDTLKSHRRKSINNTYVSSPFQAERPYNITVHYSNQSMVIVEAAYFPRVAILLYVDAGYNIRHTVYKQTCQHRDERFGSTRSAFFCEYCLLYCQTFTVVSQQVYLQRIAHIIIMNYSGWIVCLVVAVFALLLPHEQST